MPFTAQLVCSRNEAVIGKLAECPSLGVSSHVSREVEKELCLDVLQCLIAEDLFGDVFPVSTEDATCWSVAKSFPVLSESDLGPLEYEGCIGKWNMQFLQWLKAVSVATGERIDIAYEHERGDYLYEIAWWSSTPAAVDGVVETFGIESYDGSTAPEWRRDVFRLVDGRIELKLDEMTTR